jgi:hypothetical protein
MKEEKHKDAFSFVIQPQIIFDRAKKTTLKLYELGLAPPPSGNQYFLKDRFQVF